MPIGRSYFPFYQFSIRSPGPQPQPGQFITCSDKNSSREENGFSELPNPFAICGKGPTRRLRARFGAPGAAEPGVGASYLRPIPGWGRGMCARLDAAPLLGPHRRRPPQPRWVGAPASQFRFPGGLRLRPRPPGAPSRAGPHRPWDPSGGRLRPGPRWAGRAPACGSAEPTPAVPRTALGGRKGPEVSEACGLSALAVRLWNQRSLFLFRAPIRSRVWG